MVKRGGCLLMEDVVGEIDLRLPTVDFFRDNQRFDINFSRSVSTFFLSQYHQDGGRNTRKSCTY